MISDKKEIEELLLWHFREYPVLTVEDVCKLLHQSAFGCEHLVSSESAAKARIEEELQGLSSSAEVKIESLGAHYCRVYLGWLQNGLQSETLAKLFLFSAKREDEGVLRLEKSIPIALDLAKEGKAPFSAEALALAFAEWKKEGYSARRHSEKYRAAYSPAYRVIDKQYALYLPLLAQIDQMLKKGRVRLAIEGGSAAGKTTLGRLLESLYGATVLHMDDFFLQPSQRTPERLQQPGGNVDRERVLLEILLPLQKGEKIEYRPYSCEKQALLPPVSVESAPLTVIEGAYSMHPDLQSYYDFSVLLDISPDLQKKRIEKRNTPALAKRFFNEWIPMEEKYRAAFAIKSAVSLVIPVTE